MNKRVVDYIYVNRKISGEIIMGLFVVSEQQYLEIIQNGAKKGPAISKKRGQEKETEERL